MKNLTIILLVLPVFVAAQPTLRLKTTPVNTAAIVAPLNARIDSLKGQVSLLSDSLSRSNAVGYVEKTSAYTASVNDNVINCTSGTFTIIVTSDIRTKPLQIINTGGGTIRITGSKIMGRTGVKLLSGHTVTLQQTPAGYVILNQY